MISVIIPLYNKEKYIKETINKVLNQTFQDFELIVVNDGSSDKGPDIVATFDDPRIILINKKNGGVSSARNLGISNAKFDYIALLDADDEWLPNHLEEIYCLITKYGKVANVFTTNFAHMYNNKKIVVNRNDLTEGIVNNYFHEALKRAVVHTSCVCFTKKSIKKVGEFNTEISRGEDLDLWIRLARVYNIAYSPKVTMQYLHDAENNSNRKFHIKKSYVFYINKNEFTCKNDKRLNLRLLYRKYFSLLLKDFDLINFFRLFIKQGIKI